MKEERVEGKVGGVSKGIKRKGNKGRETKIRMQWGKKKPDKNLGEGKITRMKKENIRGKRRQW